MDFMKEADSDRDQERSDSKPKSMPKPLCVENCLDFQVAVHNSVKKLSQEAVDKLADSVMNIAKQTVINASETCDLGRNKAFVKGKLKSVLNDLLVSILDDSSDIRESFKDAVVQVEATPKSLAKIASAAAKDTAAMARIAQCSAKNVRQKVKISVKDLILTPLSPQSSGPDSFFNEP